MNMKAVPAHLNSQAEAHSTRFRKSAPFEASVSLRVAQGRRKYYLLQLKRAVEMQHRTIDIGRNLALTSTSPRGTLCCIPSTGPKGSCSKAVDIIGFSAYYNILYDWNVASLLFRQLDPTPKNFFDSSNRKLTTISPICLLLMVLSSNLGRFDHEPKLEADFLSALLHEQC